MTPVIHTEIAEQPDTIARVLAAPDDPYRHWADQLDPDATIVLVARGTSDNAARYARYLLAIRNRRLTSLAMPAVVSRYGRTDLIRPPTAVVAISQSGRSPDLVATVHAARQQGATTLTLTNTPDSPLADASDHVVDLACGPERSVAATKTYTATLTALARLSAMLLGERVDTAVFVDSVTRTLDMPLPVEAIAALQRARRCVVVARGYNHATAHETALKIQELTGITAQPFSTADLEHGPVAALGPDVPLIAIAPHDPVTVDVADTLEHAHRRGAPTIAVSNDDGLLGIADVPIPSPPDIPDWLSPIAAILPMQRLAVTAALRLGIDVDRPHGLRKVTETQ